MSTTFGTDQMGQKWMQRNSRNNTQHTDIFRLYKGEWFHEAIVRTSDMYELSADLGIKWGQSFPI